MIVYLNHINDQPQSYKTSIIDITDHFETIRCSICCSFLLGENWIDPFSQHDIQFFARSFAVCPACKKQALTEIHKSDDKQNLTATVIPFEAPPYKPD